MRQLFDVIFATVCAVAAVVLALWLWLVLAPQFADDTGSPNWLWIIRGGAMALVAAAQTLGLRVVVGSLFGLGPISRSLGSLAALMCTVALVVTLALI